MPSDLESARRTAWRQSDFKRAVIECALVRGWGVQAVVRTGGPATVAPVSQVAVDAFGRILMLVRRRDRRLIFAALGPDRTTWKPSLHAQRLIDLLRSLAWDPTADEYGCAEQAVAHPVPRIETFVWGPADLVAGIIDEALL